MADKPKNRVFTCPDSRGQAKGRGISRSDFLQGKVKCYDGPRQDRIITKRMWGQEGGYVQNTTYQYNTYRPPVEWMPESGFFALPQTVRVTCTGFADVSPQSDPTCDHHTDNNPHNNPPQYDITTPFDNLDSHQIQDNIDAGKALQERMRSLRKGRTWVTVGDLDESVNAQKFNSTTRDSINGLSPFIMPDQGGNTPNYIGCPMVHFHVGICRAHVGNGLMQPVFDGYQYPWQQGGTTYHSSPYYCTYIGTVLQYNHVDPDPRCPGSGCTPAGEVLGQPVWSCDFYFVTYYTLNPPPGATHCMYDGTPHTGSTVRDDAQQLVTRNITDFKTAYPHYPIYKTFVYPPQTDAGAVQFLQQFVDALPAADFGWSMRSDMESFTADEAFSLVAQAFQFNSSGKDLPQSPS